MNETKLELRLQPLGAEWCPECLLMVLPVGLQWSGKQRVKTNASRQVWGCPVCRTLTEAEEE